ncbi:CYFA0S06e02850g1_1 [Cyberlindnera fabianii]|uniref:Diphthamide biosynthesis protein 4 n=1 Tax=Cyberlindnera fabianii TaxID=36022 RepID=A0A061B2B4_CYBFA|nr:Diphthamide biosynthesis protein 4 [Cyberlindnera fabianii]CDR41158.1 CYFA0S06e02850g1_1 [Cyberlindnera fabianii]
MNSITQKSHYELLGVEPTASSLEIKAAYREKLLSTHPDKTKEVVSTDIINQIKQAYITLSDSNLRSEYDADLQESFKKSGLISSGDGLDIFSLDDFKCEMIGIGEDEMAVFKKDCPRCTTQDGFELNEADLEQSGTRDGAGGYEIIVQCAACSLWLKVKYYDLDDEDDDKDEE